jgi:hypothetical protein
MPWNDLLKIYNDIPDERTRNIFLFLFKTGSRCMEIVNLKRSQIDLNYKNNILIRGLPVEKQKEKILLVDNNGNPLFKNGKSAYKFESKESFRTFPIDRREPLSDIMIEILEKIEDPNKMFPFIETQINPMTHTQIYYSLANIGSTRPEGVAKKYWCHYKGIFYPHFLRGLRACQLIRDMGYSVYHIQKWFGWSDPTMSMEYIDMGYDELIVKKEIDWGMGSDYVVKQPEIQKPIPEHVEKIIIKPPIVKTLVPPPRPRKVAEVESVPKPKAEPKPAKDEVVSEPRKFGYMNKETITSKYMLRDMIDEQIKDIKTTEFYIIRKSKED